MGFIGCIGFIGFMGLKIMGSWKLLKRRVLHEVWSC